MQVEVKFDEKKLRDIQRMLRSIPNAMPKVMSRSINRTAKSAKVKTAQRIGAEVNVKSKSLKSRIDLEKANPAKWQAKLGISKRRISLISFKGTGQTKKGVGYRIVTGGARKLVPSAFIETVRKTGYKGVLLRMTEQRYPLAWLRGPSLGQIFEKAPGVAAEIIADAGKKLTKNIDAQVKYLLEKRK